MSNVPADTRVMADQARLLQVMTNLLGNSIKYTQEGGIGVTISEGDGGVTIRVTDTGRGIEADEQESLFQKFKQVGEKVYITDPVQGTGMGLYISHLLVESMHGKIYLEKSEVGKGSTFALQLPVAEI
jgi:signal transduction histidine kinase